MTSHKSNFYEIKSGSESCKKFGSRQNMKENLKQGIEKRLKPFEPREERG